MKTKLYFFAICLFFFNSNSTFSQQLESSDSDEFEVTYCIEPIEVRGNQLDDYTFEMRGKNIVKPIPSASPVREVFTVDTKQKKIISTQSGTKINVPANAFIDKNGNVVEGAVELNYMEMNSALDIMLSGIPMAHKDSYFESAAMFQIGAVQNGNELFPNPDAPIELGFESSAMGDDFSYYEYDTEKGEWDDKGAKALTESTASYPQFAYDMLNMDNAYSLTKEIPIPTPTALSVRTLRPKDYAYLGNKKGLQLKIQYDKKYTSNGSLKYTEWNKYNKSVWQVVGDQVRSDLKKIERRIKRLKFNRPRFIFNNRLIDKAGDERLDPNFVLDMWMSPDLENDYFQMNIVTSVDTMSIPVIPYTRSRDHHEQKQVVKFYNRYKDALSERRQNWSKKLTAYYEQINAGSSAVIAGSEDRLNIAPLKGVRTVQIRNFGVGNVDRILKLLSEDILVECEDEYGEVLKVNSIYILNEKVRTSMQFPGRVIQVPSSSNNKALVMLDDGRKMWVSKKQFGRAWRAKGDGIMKMVLNEGMLWEEKMPLHDGPRIGRIGRISTDF